MKKIRGIKLGLADQRGASAVEFALVSPLLVMFLFGIIEFGALFYDKTMVTNASREAARKGIVFRDPRVSVPEIQNVADNYCNGKMITFGSSTSPNITVPSGACVNHNDELTVIVAYQYDFLLLPDFLRALPWLRGALPDITTVQAVTKMRCE